MSDIQADWDDFKKTVLVALRDKLEEVDDFPHDFNSEGVHDTIHEAVDSFVTGFDRHESLNWIDFCGGEEHVEEGIIDHSSIDRTLITTAYECIRQHLFDDFELIMELQEYEMTESQRNDWVNQINEIVGDHKPVREDSEGQIWVETGFDLSLEDFPKGGFSKSQLVDLHDGIKILTSNREPRQDSINQNAIVIEGGKKAGQHRIYLMDKDPDADIREFFKYDPTIADMDYKLDPKLYVDGQMRKDFSEEQKKEFIWRINQMAVSLTQKSTE